jgi:hypothetical protein
MGSNNLCLLVQHKLRGLDYSLVRDLSRHFEALQGHIKYVPKLTFDKSEVLAGVNPVSELLGECYCGIIHAVDNLDLELLTVILVESVDHLLSELLDLPDRRCLEFLKHGLHLLDVPGALLATPLWALLLQSLNDRGELLLPEGLLLQLGLDAIYLLREVEDGRADFLEAVKVTLQRLNLLVMQVHFVPPVGVLHKGAQLV